jgi:hypothetical protein
MLLDSVLDDNMEFSESDYIATAYKAQCVLADLVQDGIRAWNAYCKEEIKQKAQTAQAHERLKALLCSRVDDARHGVLPAPVDRDDPRDVASSSPEVLPAQYDQGDRDSSVPAAFACETDPSDSGGDGPGYKRQKSGKRHRPTLESTREHKKRGKERSDKEREESPHEVSKGDGYANRKARRVMPRRESGQRPR